VRVGRKEEIERVKQRGREKSSKGESRKRTIEREEEISGDRESTEKGERIWRKRTGRKKEILN
jgi:hypothetical protein